MTVLQRTSHQQKLSTAWKSLPVKKKKKKTSISLCIHNPAATDCIQCEIVPRCRYRRQTVKVFVIKIFVLFGPQRPTMLFLTYAYFHYSDIKQTEKRCCRLSPVLSRVLLSQAVKTAAPGNIRIPWALGAEGPRTRCGMYWGVLWEKKESWISQYDDYR